MSRRARPGPVAADRVRALLARPPAVGWVLPPEPGDPLGPVVVADGSLRSGGSEVRPWDQDLSSVSARPREAEDGAARWDDSAPAASAPWPGAEGGPRDEPPRDVSAAGPGAADVPRDVVEPAHAVNAPRSAVDGPRDVLEPSRGRAAAPASRLAGLLPVALRTGRVDPGRRGAAALVLVAVLAAVVAGGVLLRGRPQEVLVPQVLSSGVPLPGVSASPQAGAGAEVVVAVAGTVKRPGLVRLPAGSRVDDALRAAGGVTDGAGTGLLNLARRLVDGEQVLVGVEPPPGAPAAAGAGGAAGGLLDLNTATVAELDALPGIGPVLAQRIVDWRTEHERFASVDQLREVTGIGEAKYQDLEKEVTV